jgi:uncharacterized protein YbjT (DUF2867 family)
MILVVGGTGYLGAETVRRLLARGERVRVLARNPEKAPSAAERAQGDVRDAAAVARAMVGVRVVVSAAHGFAADPRGIDGEGNANLIAAAKAANVEHFVLVSVRGASADHAIELFRMKHLAEEKLTASGLAWTILKPTAFMETWLTLLAAPLAAKGKTTIFGRGTNPINFVSAHDVAHLVEIAVTDPTLRGRSIDIGGPENMTFEQLVETFEKVTGASGKKAHVPLPMMRVMAVLMRAFNPSLARQIRAGVVLDSDDMTFDAPQIPGVHPTTLADVVRRDFVAR